MYTHTRLLTHIHATCIYNYLVMHTQIPTRTWPYNPWASAHTHTLRGHLWAAPLCLVDGQLFQARAPHPGSHPLCLQLIGTGLAPLPARAASPNRVRAPSQSGDRNCLPWLPRRRRPCPWTPPARVLGPLSLLCTQNLMSRGARALCPFGPPPQAARAVCGSSSLYGSCRSRMQGSTT